MSKQIKQTKKAKEEFYSVVTKHLVSDDFITRYELEQKLSGLTDREIRREISELRKHYAVLSGSYTKGYRLVKKLDTLKGDELLEELHYINKTINEFMTKINDMKRTLKPLIAAKKVIEKTIEL